MLKLQVKASGDWRDVVELIEAPDPVPGIHDIVVSVLAASINPADLLMIAGQYASTPPFPYTPGAECVGRVVGLGAAVTDFALGDLVMPLPGMNNWAEKVLVKAAMAFKLPRGIDVAQAAMIKANPAAAKLMLDEVPLRSGDWVVQNAANSAVGRYLIQLARRRGIKTLNVVRRAELAPELEALGATVVVTESVLAAEGLARMGGARAKLAIDAVGGLSTRHLANVLEAGSPLVCHGLLSGEPLQIDAADVVFRGITLRGFWLAPWFGKATSAEIRTLYEELISLVASGQLATAVEATFPLRDWPQALARAAGGGRGGKILFMPNK
jgi:NADPH:quinone reductase-like Zn-dependent oxidoreductase